MSHDLSDNVRPFANIRANFLLYVIGLIHIRDVSDMTHS